jgi:hypothetical protein
MIPKPSVLPAWAVNDVVDPSTGQPNVVTPPTVNQNSGWLAKDFVPNSWWNWLARYTYQWLNYLSYKDSNSVVSDGTGSVISFNVTGVTYGAVAYIYVVDKGDAANVYAGMVYLPLNPLSSVPFVDILKVGITTPEISISGTVTVTGGTGPYICYCQTIPALS